MSQILKAGVRPLDKGEGGPRRRKDPNLELGHEERQESDLWIREKGVLDEGKTLTWNWGMKKGRRFVLLPFSVLVSVARNSLDIFDICHITHYFVDVVSIDFIIIGKRKQYFDILQASLCKR